MEKHVPNLIAALWVLGFFALLLALSRLVRPDNNSAKARKELVAHDGSNVRPWIRMAARYHLLVAAAAMFFLGVLILYPAIATFKQWIEDGHGVAALVSVGLFMSSLSVALAYAWMKGDLSWTKDKEDNGNPRERLT